MPQLKPHPRVYEGDGDQLMRKEHTDLEERLIIIPDALPSKTPDPTPRLRIMWGQHLLEDLLAGRYRTLVCAVNTTDNSRGIITQLASVLPTSQWDEHSITDYARHFTISNDRARVLKYDMDMVEVLAILRPEGVDHLRLRDLSQAFRIVTEMIGRRPALRWPSASVSFLGAKSNRLLEDNGEEPSFEAVLRTMHEAGYNGDIYPAPAMWHSGDTGLFARYPFSAALDDLRQGGF